jgi:CxxC motif-containing protein (DUF1111 family)
MLSVGRIAMRVLAPMATCVSLGATPLPSETPDSISLGRSLFYTEWSPAGPVPIDGGPVDGHRMGLGPLFNAASCNTCHNDGSGGHGPTGSGVIAAGLEIQLESTTRGTDGQPSGDPLYGYVFNTAALPGIRPEGTVTVRYTEIYGYYYPDGIRWHMRKPHYRLVGLSLGPLADNTVIKPRLAPALFGVGLLEAVPDGAIAQGRFGWQGSAISIRDQTTRALAREMGLTSSDRPADDCTAAEADCLEQPGRGSAEVPEELVAALIDFQRALPVPAATASDELGAELFVVSGCATCHRQRLPVEWTRGDGSKAQSWITPYTDLRLHDLGPEMTDETAAGKKVPSQWRTAPLWALGHRLRTDAHTTLLHDGRARSVEEAILWHSGEAAQARRNFMNLGPRSRGALLHWLATR